MVQDNRWDGGLSTASAKLLRNRRFRSSYLGHAQIPPNRKTERAGANAVQALFDKCGYVFQPVALDNDFGKDAYVDLVHDRTSRNNGERTWGSTKKNELTDAG